MLARIRQWFAPPVFEGDRDKSSTAVLLNTILWIALVGMVLLAGSMIVTGLSMAPVVTVIVGAVILLSLVLLVLLRLGFVRPAAMILTIAMWVGFTVPMVSLGGIHDTAVTGYFVVILLAGTALGRRSLIVFSALSILAVGATYIAENTGLISPNIPLPSVPNDPVLIALALVGSAVILRYALRQLSEAYDLARRDAAALAETNAELAASRDALAAQTAELERRTRYLEATAEVAREASSVLNLEQLLDRIIVLIAERFEILRLGIFLQEPGSGWAVLRAASGQGGVQGLGRDVRVRVDGEGIVARVIRSGQLHLARDVSPDPLYLDLEKAADTRSELTLPLRARGEVLGALTVQSPETDAFSDKDVSTMQTLADQVALAISNAQLFQQGQESLEAERRAYGELSREAWQEMIRAQPDLAIIRDERGVSSLDTWLDAEVEQALETGQSATSEEAAIGLAVPIRVRGQIIGAIDAHKREGTQGWTSDQITMLETLADQLGGALDGARLYQDTQRAGRSRACRSRDCGPDATGHGYGSVAAHHGGRAEQRPGWLARLCAPEHRGSPALSRWRRPAG